MRYIGILIMAGAAVWGGFFAAQCLKERLDILLLCRQMVYHLKSQILYTNATLPEALEEVGTRFSEEREGNFKEPGLCFKRIAERMEKEDIPFFGIWKEEVEKLPAQFPMDKTDRKHLAALGENLGYADRDMQERTLLFYLEQADDSIASLKREFDTRAKLYRSLGMAAGLFLMVILA